MATVETKSTVEDLETRLEARKAQLSDLATMGGIVTSILEIDAVLSVTIDMAIRLVDGEVGVILLEENGELTNQVSWGVGVEFIKSLHYKDGLDIATYAFENREPVILSNLGLRSDEGIVLESVIACPIQTEQRCRGVMVVINKSSGGGFTASDQEAMSMLLNFVAVAVENSHLVKHKLEQQKVAQEMAIARQVQETILADEVDDFSGVDIGAIYFPAGEVGGDFYDILSVGERSLMVILGDVSNKGIPAALVMSACSGIIKTTVDRNPKVTVSELADTVNRLLAEKIIKDREMFVTMFFARIDLDEKSMTYCNAGHIPGLFWDSRAERIIELPEGGPIVGQFVEATYTEGRRTVVSDDRLFLFTDGLTEAVDVDGNLFGRERAQQVFSREIGLAPTEFCHRVKEWVDRYSEDAPEESIDDFTILQVRLE